LETQRYQANVTFKQVVDIVRGRKIISNYMDAGLALAFKKCLGKIKDFEVRRIILRMLKVKILKETFISTKGSK